MTARTNLAIMLALAACTHKPPPPVVARLPHFVVGAGYQSQGEWRYPQAFNSYDVTGLSDVLADTNGGVTMDNEVYDAEALAAASPVLQLPSIITVTNLVNGYSMDVRVNERGPDDPGRILAVTPRVARLLGMPSGGVVEVEVTLKPRETAALDGTLGQGPKLTAVPLAGITAQALAAPGSGQSAGGVQNLSPQEQAGPVADVGVLSGRVIILPASPGPLYVQIPGFGRERDARAAQQNLYGIASEVVPVFGGDRVLYAVDAGPYASVAAADAALRRLLARGVTDPQIIVR